MSGRPRDTNVFPITAACFVTRVAQRVHQGGKFRAMRGAPSSRRSHDIIVQCHYYNDIADTRNTSGLWQKTEIPSRRVWSRGDLNVNSLTTV
jgi:hypothetical protein